MVKEFGLTPIFIPRWSVNHHNLFTNNLLLCFSKYEHVVFVKSINVHYLNLHSKRKLFRYGDQMSMRDIGCIFSTATDNYYQLIYPLIVLKNACYSFLKVYQNVFKFLCRYKRQKNIKLLIT